ncbi:MAG: hypothetical protein BMS9Abin15_0059 [Gammaproteobacteria bacterium]|nr:MAG: hypothetical protein BMS9Abin15_0059 [Gammaproteobacteria bacterium]
MVTKKHLNIQRIDTETNSTHCWVVVVQRRSKIYRKMFSDGVYGGKRKALQNAIIWRDKIIAKYPPLSKKQYITIKRKNNKSGVPGVCRFQKHGRWHWVTSWATGVGKSKQLAFSSDEYGEEKAFKKACAARRKAVKQVSGVFLPNSG